MTQPKVKSCTHLVLLKGQPFAVPYGHSARSTNSTMTDWASVNQNDFSYKPPLHIGMPHKPLVKYSPTAQRSRLDYTHWKQHKKNESTLRIGSRHNEPDALHFRSTAQILMQQLPKQLDMFPGTSSDKLKWLRHRQWS